MIVFHCVSSHEPVVNTETCIYCGSQMKTEFDATAKTGHNFEDCDQCVLIKDSWVNQGCSKYRRTLLRGQA